MAQPTADFFNSAIFLVDASSYIFRAYYAIQIPLKAPDGTPTQATYGFIQMVQALDREHKNPRIALIWDRKEKGFRHEAFPEYKANRSAPPEDLGIQIQNVRQGATLLGFPQWDAPGFEADDIIATLVRKNPEQNFVIVTADKDLLQLVGPHVWCLDTFKRKWSNIEEAREKFGVEPHQICEIQALCGDSVDNIPGAPGVGPKTAIELITHFKSLDIILAEAEKRWQDPMLQTKSDPLKGKRLEAIATNLEKVRTSLQLVCLRDDVPVNLDLSAFTRQHIDRDALSDWAKSLGFTKLVASLSAVAKTAEDKPGAPKSKSDAVKIPEENSTAPSLVASDIDPQLSSPVKVVTISSLEQLKKIFEVEQIAAKAMAFDTESFNLEARASQNNMVGISFCFDSETGYYVPLRHQVGENVEPGQALAIVQNIFHRGPQILP